MKRRSRIIALFLAMALIFGCFTTTTFAAAKKKTVKYSQFTTETSVAKKKATTFKMGTTNFTVKKGSGYIKFVAPKAKTYKFTFSNMKGKNTNNGFISFYTPYKSYPDSLDSIKLKTKGGKDSTLWLSFNGTKFTTGSVLGRPIAKRTGTVKLKKGQVVYLRLYAGSSNFTGKLVIK